MLSESDLALVHALQVQPRASFSELATVLGWTSATAARRWQRLRDAGAAWVSAVPGPRCEAFVAYIGLRCAGGQRQSVADSLTRDPCCVTVELTTGSYDLLAEVITPDLASFSRYLLDHVENLAGVDGVTVATATTVVTEASRWRLDALDPEQTSALHHTDSAASRAQARRLTALDRQLLLELGQDGRQPWEQLGRTAGTSAATARRRTERLVDSGEVVLRCDVAAALFERPITATLWIEAPTGELGTVARSLINVSPVRFVATIAGQANLLVMAWLRSTGEVHRLEAELATSHPSLRVSDRTISLRTAKRMGRILDDTGRCVATVPLGPWVASS